MRSGLISGENLEKLEALENPHVMEIVERFAGLCEPSRVIVVTDDPEEIAYIRRMAIEKGEEMRLRLEGHTVHFDG